MHHLMIFVCQYSWVDDTSQTQMKEMKIVYTFNYLPGTLIVRSVSTEIHLGLFV